MGRILVQSERKDSRKRKAILVSSGTRPLKLATNRISDYCSWVLHNSIKKIYSWTEGGNRFIPWLVKGRKAGYRVSPMT